MIVAIFNCSQANFIVVVQTGLNSYFQFLSDFNLFSKIYSKEWGNTLQSNLDIAAAMPDADTLRSTSESKRRDLVKAHRLACKSWRALKRYISKVYESDLVALKLKAAGGNYYKEAKEEKWPIAQQMFTNALNFVETNKAVLEPVMAENFQTDFTNLVKNYKKELGEYEQTKEAITEGTQARLKKLNEIHRTFMDMMLDGQAIFEDNEAILKQFVFTEILAKVSGPGLAGVRGQVTDIVSNAAIVNATVTITDETGQQIGATTTDAEGKFFVNTPSGTYKVVVTANGFIIRTFDDFSVDIGTVSKLDVALSPVEGEDAG